MAAPFNSLAGCKASTKVDAWYLAENSVDGSRRQRAATAGTTHVQTKVYAVDFTTKEMAKLDANRLVEIVLAAPNATVAELFGHTLLAVYTGLSGSASTNATTALPQSSGQVDVGGTPAAADNDTASGGSTTPPSQGGRATSDSSEGTSVLSIAIIATTITITILVCAVLAAFYVRYQTPIHEFESNDWVVHTNQTTGAMKTTNGATASQDPQAALRGSNYGRPYSQSYFDPVPTQEDSWNTIQAVLLADHGGTVSAGYSAYGTGLGGGDDAVGYITTGGTAGYAMPPSRSQTPTSALLPEYSVTGSGMSAQTDNEWAAIQNAVQTGGGRWLDGDGPELLQTSEAGGHAIGSDGYIITGAATQAVPDGPAAATAGSDTAGSGSHYYPGGGENLPPMLAIPEAAEATAGTLESSTTAVYQEAIRAAWGQETAVESTVAVGFASGLRTSVSHYHPKG